nr:MAG TPA: hypothetical protein [Caudoviricetes sp.]
MKEVLQTRSYGMVSGVLSEKDIEVKQLPDGREKIQGAVTIENKQGVYRVSVNNIFHYTKGAEETEENETRGWKNWIGFMSNGVDKKEAAKNGTNPSYVNCTISLNTYERVNRNGNGVASYTNLSGNFITVVDKASVGEGVAEFSVECIIKAIKPETDNNGETGRALVDVYTVDYFKNMHVVHIVVPEEYYDAIMNGYVDEVSGEYVDKLEVGDTITLYCEIANVGGSTKPVHSGFGRKVTVLQGFTRQEFQLVGADIPKNKSNNPMELEASFDEETIKQLEKEMNIRLEEIQTNSVNNTSSQSSQPKFGNKSSIKERMASMSLDDMPF